jgi:RNA polymerase sigma-70 factor (ECF subfamily)
MIEEGAAPPGVSREADAERDLIARATNGDEAAFTALYDAHYQRVYRYVHYRLAKTQDVEDVSQKVFLQAWRGLKRYRPREVPFVAWLITIAHNETMSFFRSNKRALFVEWDDSIHEVAIDSESMLERRYEQANVREAILRLNSDQQQVVTMRFLEGFDYIDIAAALGKAEGTVRVIQHRALQHLRRILQEGGQDGQF